MTLLECLHRRESIESWDLKSHLEHPHYDFQYRRATWHACAAFGSSTCGLISKSRSGTGARQRQWQRQRQRQRQHQRPRQRGKEAKTNPELGHAVIHGGPNPGCQIRAAKSGTRPRSHPRGAKSGVPNPSYESGTRPRSHPREAKSGGPNSSHKSGTRPRSHPRRAKSWGPNPGAQIGEAKSQLRIQNPAMQTPALIM